MKTHLIWALIALACILIGGGIQKLRDSTTLSGDASIAGQTLADLSRAIENAKTTTGTYPDSIKDLKVTPTSPESSAELLKKVLYFKTHEGFVAFVGVPMVVYIRPGTSAIFQLESLH
jgi:hypothetical protein